MPIGRVGVRLLLATVLRDVNRGAVLVSVVTQPRDHYTVTISLPGEPDMPLILNERLVEQAATNVGALRALRAFLTSAAQRSPGAEPASSETAPPAA